MPRSLLERPVLEVAPRLLGCRVTIHGVTVRLTEVEAYGGESDPGSHAYRGRTPRTEVMFGPAGHLYVYLSYGMHLCANLVTGDDGSAAAVLLRAGEVVGGRDLAAGRRAGVRERDWARGPGRLGATLGLSRADNGTDLCGADDSARVEPPSEPVDPERFRSGPRVGVSGAGGDGSAFPWRFWLADEPTVSSYRPARPGHRSRRAQN
ncbi:MAG: DNA-3-methyladenine glycosylase [Actinomycetia bacterium]|nr:DNA-3-methyladenine glycosylase [Actinomycetes bacterium]